VPLFLYSLYRVALLLAAFGLLLLLGAQPVVAAVVAVIVASAVAYLFLRKQRDATTAWLASKAEARKAGRTAGPKSRFARRVAEDESVEDAADEAS
jgi:uncharacterized membrane protein YraQ (UPF0718 family)